jgi:uncharacterized membrane protein
MSNIYLFFLLNGEVQDRLIPSAVLALPAWISWEVCLLYLVGLAFLVTGLVIASKEAPQTGLLDRLVLLGPVFFAVPIAVFGTEHFLEARAMAKAVPSWIPGQLFWAYFVGAALICAAVSMVVKRYVGLSAALFGIMMLLFEVLLHIPRVFAAPHNRFAWNIVLREFTFAGGAFALAITQSKEWRTRGTHRFLWVPRLLIGIPITVFGVEYFLYPLFVPGIPLNRLMPAWVPAAAVWNYATGAVQVVTGLCLVINRKARPAAIWLGLTILFHVIFIYVPIMVTDASSLRNELNLNYVFDTLLLSGAAFLLAGSQSPQPAMKPALASQPELAATK